MYMRSRCNWKKTEDKCSRHLQKSKNVKRKTVCICMLYINQGIVSKMLLPSDIRAILIVVIIIIIMFSYIAPHSNNCSGALYNDSS